MICLRLQLQVCRHIGNYVVEYYTLKLHSSCHGTACRRVSRQDTHLTHKRMRCALKHKCRQPPPPQFAVITHKHTRSSSTAIPVSFSTLFWAQLASLFYLSVFLSGCWALVSRTAGLWACPQLCLWTIRTALLSFDPLHHKNKKGWQIRRMSLSYLGTLGYALLPYFCLSFFGFSFFTLICRPFLVAFVGITSLLTETWASGALIFIAVWLKMLSNMWERCVMCLQWHRQEWPSNSLQHGMW